VTRSTPAAVLAALALLAGCASAPTPAALSGRIALLVEAAPPAPARRFQAGFELRGDAQRGELDLTDPLGLVAARARWQPGAAELTTSDGAAARFGDLSELAERAFGEPLPLAALPDWLRGRPWPQAPHVRTAQGFEQLGWVVDLSRYADGQVVARRAAAPEVTLRARLDATP
jgi:outer membrane lipoprotein LolB